jgi:hypothetical protein
MVEGRPTMTSHRAAIETLSKLLGLPLPGPYSQDWQYEVSDATRVEDFISAYDTNRLHSEDQCVLMSLILDSYESAISEGIARSEDCDRISYYLARDSNIHSATIDHWAALDEDDSENWFHVSPLIRSLRQTIGGAEGNTPGTLLFPGEVCVI